MSSAYPHTAEGLLAVLRRLRAPDGCPWDRKQTRSSLIRHFAGECGELFEAIDQQDPPHICEELGDVLMNLLFQVAIAEEKGEFSWHDVCAEIVEKMIRRHAHIFGDAHAETPEEVEKLWAKIKQQEKGKGTRENGSVMDGISYTLSALERSEKIQKKAAGTGFDWTSAQGVLGKIQEEVCEVKEAMQTGEETAVDEELGDLLFAVVNLIRFRGGKSSEELLRGANRKFERRFRRMEAFRAAEGGRREESLSPETWETLWNQVKEEEKKETEVSLKNNRRFFPNGGKERHFYRRIILMRKDFLPFTKPNIEESDITAVSEVLRSGWITNGPVGAEFERSVAEFTGSKHAVALSSATAGMHLLMCALNIGPGDEVITPSMTWVSTVNMIVLAGAKPVFVDVDRETMLVSPEAIRNAITERTKLIIPVHFAGAPVDIDAIRAVAGNIPVAEDAAHAMGTYYKGRHVGQSDYALYSFHAIKNVTCGEGGMFLTDDDEMAALIRRWKFHGIVVDAFDRQNRGRAPQAEVFYPGFKYNLTDMQAALGLGQLRRIEKINARRAELAALYREKFQNIPEIRPLALPQGYDFVHAWHLFVVRVDSPKMDRNTFMAKLKEQNIGTGLHFRCAHLQKFYREHFGFQAGMLPNTEYNSDHICSLPLFPDMKDGDVDDVIEAIKNVLA